MKKFLNACIIFALPLFISCSKSDDNSIDVGNSEGIIKVEVSNNDGFNNFDEAVNIQIVGSDLKNTSVTGADWDDVQEPHSSTKWFLKQGMAKPTISYQTTSKVKSLTYACLITPRGESEIPLETTVKISIDGKVVETKTYTTTSKDVQSISLPVVVGKK